MEKSAFTAWFTAYSQAKMDYSFLQVKLLLHEHKYWTSKVFWNTKRKNITQKKNHFRLHLLTIPFPHCSKSQVQIDLSILKPEHQSYFWKKTYELDFFAAIDKNNYQWFSNEKSNLLCDCHFYLDGLKAFLMSQIKPTCYKRIYY